MEQKQRRLDRAQDTVNGHLERHPNLSFQQLNTLLDRLAEEVVLLQYIQRRLRVDSSDLAKHIMPMVF